MFCTPILQTCHTFLPFQFDNNILALVAHLRRENIEMRAKLDETEEKLEVLFMNYKFNNSFGNLNIIMTNLFI